MVTRGANSGTTRSEGISCGPLWKGSTVPAALLYSARTREDLIFHEELTDLARSDTQPSGCDAGSLSSISAAIDIDLPQEAPRAFADAVVDFMRRFLCDQACRTRLE